MGKACKVWENPVRLGKHSDLPCPELSPRTGWELHRPNLVGGGVSWPEHRIGGQEAGQSGQLPSLFFPPFSFSPPLPAPLTSPHVFPILPSSLFPFLSPPLSSLLSSGSTKPMSSKSQPCGPERPQVFLQPSRGSSILSRLQPFPRLRRPDPLLKGQLYPTHLSMVSILLA